jgi:hypothetical protein
MIELIIHELKKKKKKERKKEKKKKHKEKNKKTKNTRFRKHRKFSLLIKSLELFLRCLVLVLVFKWKL